MSHVAYRRGFGLLSGAVIGLIFGLISQYINHLILPGISLYQPPFGAFGNVILSTVLGAALGWISAWAETAVVSIFWAALFGAFVVTLANLLASRSNPNMLQLKITALLLIFVPVAAGLAPILGIFRWMVSREENNYREIRAGYPPTRLQRIGFPAALLLVTILSGSFARYNDLAVAVLPRMQALIQQGQQAQTAQALPAPLRSENVTLFQERGRGAFALQWDKDDQNKYMIPRPATNQFDQSTVIAHFDNGYMLVCIFPSKEGDAECKDFAHEQ